MLVHILDIKTLQLIILYLILIAQFQRIIMTLAEFQVEETQMCPDLVELVNHTTRLPESFPFPMGVVALQHGMAARLVQ